MVLIDLDTRADVRAARRARVGRLWGAALALLLVGVATLDRRPAPDLVAVARLPPGTMRIVAAGDAFYVLRGNGSLAWNVTAYAWADGAERWRRPLAGPDPDVVVVGDPAEGAVLVTHQPCDEQHPARVERLDPATGRARWAAPGAIVAQRGVLLLARSGTGCGPTRRVAELSGVDPADGRPRWTVSFPQPRTVVAGPDWFAATAAGGATDVYATATGARLASGAVPPAGTAVAAADVLVVATGRRLSTYTRGSFGSLTPGWRSDLDTVPSALRPCGALLCVVERDILTAVDPRSGELRWQRPATGALEDALDPALVDLRGWRLVPATEGATELAAQRPAGRGVVVAVVSLTAGTVRPLGRLPAPATRCVVGPRRLACLDTTGATRIWRAPR